jgi:rhodanese-related sulfurtransferase
MLHHARSSLFAALLLLAALAAPGCGDDDTSPTDATDEATPEADGADVDADADADAIDEAEAESGADVDDRTDVDDTTDADETLDVPPAPCSPEEVAMVTDATVDELHARIVAGDALAVVDVREASETASGIIEGALLFPWSSGALSAGHATLPTDRPLYVICGSGGRSVAASAFLVDNGHFCVHNVQGGMSAWRSAGYPTITP